ncbi:hypothetical protein [Sediminitomix flava]|uniref:Lipoprotein n=1 Tax=Sediminitomix flava TaxID=379075 RepID=A0A315ZEP2_SEDFL|nr:hypothetical protein [Sediminitomix flava]PWJ44001.1 hypothetical protein BC781_101351 [Sediminitomix flava]
MKSYLFFNLILFLLLITSCSTESAKNKGEEEKDAVQSSLVYVINDDEASLVLSSSNSKSDLEQLKEIFKKDKDIDLDFSKSTFTDKGKLKRLHMIVDCNDGFKGDLEVSSLTLKLKKQGFRRDYLIRDNVPFYIGNM